MKYLFLLLALAGCDIPKQRAKMHAAEAKKAAEAMSMKDIQALSETEYKLFINDGNPYLKEYQEFFAEQLQRYGKNAKGEALVNFIELYAFASSHSFLGIYRFMEENFTIDMPAWATTNAGVFGKTEDSCSQGFNSEFFPDIQIISEKNLRRYVDYCMDSSPTYALAAALRDLWHSSNIIRLAEMGADVTNITNKYGHIDNPYTYLYGRELSLVQFFYEKRKVPLPDDALWSAFSAQSKGLFNYFLRQGADIHWVSPAGTTILYSFFYDEQLPMVETLIQRGLNPNTTDARGVTAFLHLLSINKLSMAKSLLKYTDINILPPGQTNLMEAALWAKREFYHDQNLELAPEVVQFISNLSSGK